MPNNNKPAVEVKYSNLSATQIDIIVILCTLIVGVLLLIFAPNFMLVVGKILGYTALVAMAVVPFLFALIELYEDER